MGLIQKYAAKGRNGDTKMVHATPGEVVIPREVAATQPGLVGGVMSAVQHMGGDHRKLVVGRGSINPATGMEEFATQEEVAAAYQSNLGRAPDAEGLAYWMNQGNLSGFASAAQTEIASRAAPTVYDNGTAYANGLGGAQPVGSKYWGDSPMPASYQATLPQLASNTNSAIEAARTYIKGLNKANGYSDVGSYGLGVLDAGGAQANQYATNLLSGAGANLTLTNDYGTSGIYGTVPNAEELVRKAIANSQSGSGGSSPAAQPTASNSWSQATPPPAPPPVAAPIPAAAPAAAQATQQQWTVTPQMTVQQQAADIINKDGELMQQARSTAMQQMNARGLVNSSMAVGAGQQAVLNSALEIAKPDANTYASAGQFNAGQFNDVSKFNAGQSNTWNTNALDRTFNSGENALDRNLTVTQNDANRSFTAGQSALDRDFNATQKGLDRASSTSENALNRGFTAAENTANRAADVVKYNFDATTRTNLATLGNTYDTQMQRDSSVANAYTNLTSQMAGVDADPNLDGPAKTAAKGRLTNQFTDYARIRGLNMDLLFDRYEDVSPAATGAGTATGLVNTASGGDAGSSGASSGASGNGGAGTAGNAGNDGGPGGVGGW